MKTKMTALLSCLATLILCQTSFVFAHDSMPGHGSEGMELNLEAYTLPGVLSSEDVPKSGPCAELNLEAEQKAKLREAYFKHEENQIDLMAQIEKTHLNYEKVASAADTSDKKVKEASQKIVDSVTARNQSDEAYKNQVNFEILKKEQRPKAIACRHQLFLQDHPWFKGHSESDKTEPEEKSTDDKPSKDEPKKDSEK